MLDFLGLDQKLALIFTNTLFKTWPSRFPNFHTVIKRHGDKNEKQNFFNILI